VGGVGQHLSDRPLLLLLFAPPSPGTNLQSFGAFVAITGIAFRAIFRAADWPISLKTGERVAAPRAHAVIKVIWTCTFRCDGG